MEGGVEEGREGGREGGREEGREGKGGRSREKHTLLPEDDVSPLRVCRDGRGDGGKPVGVENGFLSAGELSKPLLQLKVNIWEEEKGGGGGGGGGRGGEGEGGGQWRKGRDEGRRGSGREH